MQANRMRAVVAILAAAPIFLATGIATSFAQAPKPQPVAAGANDLQRSAEVFTYRQAGPSGAVRGEVLYYYKCWPCHNDYTRAAGTPAPGLKDIFKRTILVTGDPVNDENVAKQIRNGSPQMPSFGTTLKDADVADLLAYLHDGCCYEEINPPRNPWYRATAQNSPAMPARGDLRGGPTGLVRADAGPLEGMQVQLIAPNAVRTTVTTNRDGRYEFPKLLPGSYTLRIARPLEFQPYQRDSVQVGDGAKLDDIVLQRRAGGDDLLPPTEDVLAQLSGVELLWNIPGTGEEKHTFSRMCGEGCHGYDQIMRNRYDERSWRLILFRMMHYSGSPLIVRGRARGNLEAEEMLVKWLARVRGPDSQLAGLTAFPRAHGPATDVVVTEYELPHVLLATHDVAGDSKGNIWYSSHRTPYLGKLDPRTGVVTEYKVPDPGPGSGVLPGTHRITVDRNDIVWASENWAHNLVRLDPASGDFTIIPLKAGDEPLNTPGLGNFSIGPDGAIWFARSRAVQKFDSKTGKLLERVPFTIDLAGPYDNIITDDGNFWAGGSPAGGGNTIELMDTRTNKLTELHSLSRDSTPARGGFDKDANPWFGGRGGALLELDAKAGQIREFWPPVPYVTFYEAMPDKRGEVWAGALHSGRMLRFNPQADQWTQYVLPEPYSHDRRTWIDNSTTPVTVWYVDHNSYMVRVQPRE
jgi:streptogramin lyase/mono/diheme cytochrome c family protein